MVTTGGRIRRADAESDYKRFCVDPSRIDTWEDGRRQPDQPGSFEWWYFEIRLSTAALVIAFMDKPMTLAGGGIQPVVSVRAHLIDGLHGDECPFPPADFSADMSRCDVRIEKNTCRDDGCSVYSLKFDAAGIKGTVRIVASGPPVRIGTGHLLFEDGAADQYLGWIVGVPCGKAHVDCTIDGKLLQGTGQGYHDHNWGDRPLPSAVHHWYWGRAEIGGFTIIFANITPQPAFGSSDMAEIVLIEGGRLVASGSRGVSFVASAPVEDPETTKPISRVININFKSHAMNCMVTFASISKLIRLREGQEAAYHRDLAACTMLVRRGHKYAAFGPVITSFEMVWFGVGEKGVALDMFRRGFTRPVDASKLL